MFFDREVSAAPGGPAPPRPHWPSCLSIRQGRREAARGRGAGAPVPSVCDSGGAHLYVEVGGVEAPRRDEPGLGRPQVPRHQLPGPLHQELTVPLRRHLAPGAAWLRPGRRAARMRHGAARARFGRTSAPGRLGAALRSVDGLACLLGPTELSHWRERQCSAAFLKLVLLQVKGHLKAQGTAAWPDASLKLYSPLLKSPQANAKEKQNFSSRMCIHLSAAWNRVLPLIIRF